MKKIHIYIFAVLCLVATPVAFFKISPSTHLIPFNCTSFSLYALNKKSERITFKVAQEIRLPSLESGYIIIKGTTSDKDGVDTVLDRRIALINGSIIESSTVNYKISEISKSATDTTPDAMFNILLNEISAANNTLALDILKVDDDIWIVGTPVSFIFACKRY